MKSNLQWTKITQDNCDTVYELDSQDYPIMIANKLDDNYITYHNLCDCTPSIGTMAKLENYYYIVLPKLK